MGQFERDLFGPRGQGSLSFAPPPPRDYTPKPENIRAKLHALLAKARAAEPYSWPDDDMNYWRLVFPQMSNWLPKDEAMQLCLEFEAELARVNSARQDY